MDLWLETSWFIPGFCIPLYSSPCFILQSLSMSGLWYSLGLALGDRDFLFGTKHSEVTSSGKPVWEQIDDCQGFSLCLYCIPLSSRQYYSNNLLKFLSLTTLPHLHSSCWNEVNLVSTVLFESRDLKSGPHICWAGVLSCDPQLPFDYFVFKETAFH